MSIEWFKRQSLLLVFLAALLVLVPRSAYIASVHSECIDDEYHLVRGVRFLTGKLDRSPLNDPVLGSAIMALPLWLADVTPNINAKRGDNVYKYGQVLHGQKVPVETLTMRIALWKSILFVPGVLLAFVWVRRLYNERAAWIAAALFLVEPTISAHIAPAGLDVLGFEAILVACFCWWRYFEKQTWLRLIAAAVVSAAAMLVKHTAIIVPMVALIYAVAWWIKRWREARGISPALVVGEEADRDPATRGDDGRLTTPPATEGKRKNGSGVSLGRDLIHAFCAIIIAAVALHFQSGGSVQIRRPDSIAADSMIGKLFERPMPAGYYIKSIQTAMYHGGEGHPSWLLGERNDEGSWYYYPIVALYKVPIALLVFLTLGTLSLIKIRPRFGELALLVPMLLLMALITTGGINIGFRHAIPAYALLLMLCCRVMLIDIRWLRTLIVALVAITLIDTARYFPNLISYINFPREKVWMDVNDSNLDWGQGLKQIRQWVQRENETIKDRPIGVRYFGLDYSPNVEHYLKGTAATRVPRNVGPPGDGILIISPVYVAGMFERPGLYDFLRTETPIDIIGDSNLVFDLDEIYSRRPETRPVPTTTPAE